MKEGKEGCWALKRRGRWGIPFVMEWTSSQRHFITAFNGHISLLTDRRTKWEIYDRRGDLSGTFTSARARAAAPNRTGLHRSLSPPVQDDVSALWSGQWQEWEHMSKLAKSASSAEASCLARELSRLRCLAPFPPQSCSERSHDGSFALLAVCQHLACTEASATKLGDVLSMW